MAAAPLAYGRIPSTLHEMRPVESKEAPPKHLKLTIQALTSEELASYQLGKREVKILESSSIKCRPLSAQSTKDYSSLVLQDKMKVEVDKVLANLDSACLGRGATGLVYPFEFEGNSYAFKVLTPDYSRESATLREFKFAHLLDPHPNLMKPLFSTNVIIPDRTPYESPCMIMECVPGRSLIDHLLAECANAEPYCINKSDLKLSDQSEKDGLSATGEYDKRIFKLKTLTVDLAAALRHLHAQGVVHRDVKPENVMRVENEDGSFKHVLLDYGNIRDPFTRSGIPERFIAESVPSNGCSTPCGTSYYMSPEVHKVDTPHGDAYSFSSDIWSLGALIYSAAFSRFPYHIIDDDPFSGGLDTARHKETPADYPSDTPEALVDLLKQCFKADPKARVTADQILSHPFITDLEGLKAEAV